MTICYIMNRCLVMFLRGEKVNVVQYWWNIFVKLKGEQVIILQMDQRLKTKNISDVPGQISYCQCKYLVKDTDNEFTEYQTPRKKFQSIGISLVSLHAFTETLKSFLYVSFEFPLVSLSLALVSCLSLNESTSIFLANLLWGFSWKLLLALE